MTKAEAQRINRQEAILMDLGFTSGDAETLRRISMTLHRWHERECGDGDRALVRGRWDDAAQDFTYDDEGQPYEELAGESGRRRYVKVQDKEKGALTRLNRILNGRNARMAHDAGPIREYIQSDPRGAALYLLRPGDVPEGARDDAYYTRGICVY